MHRLCFTHLEIKISPTAGLLNQKEACMFFNYPPTACAKLELKDSVACQGGDVCVQISCEMGFDLLYLTLLLQLMKSPELSESKAAQLLAEFEILITLSDGKQFSF